MICSDLSLDPLRPCVRGRSSVSNACGPRSSLMVTSRHLTHRYLEACVRASSLRGRDYVPDVSGEEKTGATVDVGRRRRGSIGDASTPGESSEIKRALTARPVSPSSEPSRAICLDERVSLAGHSHAEREIDRAEPSRRGPSNAADSRGVPLDRGPTTRSPWVRALLNGNRPLLVVDAVPEEAPAERLVFGDPTRAAVRRVSRSPRARAARARQCYASGGVNIRLVSSDGSPAHHLPDYENAAHPRSRDRGSRRPGSPHDSAAPGPLPYYAWCASYPPGAKALPRGGRPVTVVRGLPRGDSIDRSRSTYKRQLRHGRFPSEQDRAAG